MQRVNKKSSQRHQYWQ